MSRILADVKANFLIWARSPSAIFFTLAFPVIIIAIFGSIFGPDNNQPVEVAVQDLDRSPQSRQLMDALNRTGAVDMTVAPPTVAGPDWAVDGQHHTLLVIPQGYGRNVTAGRTSTLLLYTDPAHQGASVAAGVIGYVVQDFNVRVTGQQPRLRLAASDLPIASDEVEGGYVAFLVPGLVGMTLATSSMMGGLEVAATLKQAGILRRVIITPMRRWEWVVAKSLYQVGLMFVTLVVLMLAAWAFYGVKLRLGWEPVVLLALGATGFAALATALSRWVKRPDQANAVGATIAFPMFFISGAFFPASQMPPFLALVAKALPLTYVIEGMRASMISADFGEYLVNLAGVAAFAAIAIALASVMVPWKEA